MYVTGEGLGSNSTANRGDTPRDTSSLPRNTSALPGNTSSLPRDTSAGPRSAAPGKKRPAPPPPPQKKMKTGAAGSAEAAKARAAPAGLSSAAPPAVKAAGDNAESPSAPSAAEGPASAPLKQGPAEAPAGLSRLHSRNSSDSSGYHELTLSGAESPEAWRVPTALKTSIDTTSIESADHPNGDSGVQDLSPPGAEGSSLGGQLAEGAVAHAGRGTSGVQQQQQQQRSQAAGLGKPEKKPKPLPSTKKKKAPPPPPKAKPAPVQEESSGVASGHPEPPCPAPSTSVPRERAQPPPPQHVQENRTTAVYALAEKTSSRAHPEGESDSDSDSGEAFNLNDIMEAVDFEDGPPRTTTITTTDPDTPTTATSRSARWEEESGALAMVETASVLSEDVQVPDDVKSRPCEFIPPPPPDEPPPEDYLPPTGYPQPGEYLSAGPEPVYLDKGTVVGEDNASLAPASLKGSPVAMYHRRCESRGSIASLGSVDTVEGLSLAFAQTIALGEETLESEQWQEEQGYANDMARFVAQMRQLGTDRPADSGDLSSNDTSLSLPDTESVSDTGSVIYHGAPCHVRGDSRDSQSGPASSDRPPDPVGDGGAGEASGFAVMEEIDAPLETVPPPLEFRGDEEEEEDQDEGVTVVTEEYIVPLGPGGPEYSAAVKTSGQMEKGSAKNAMDSLGAVFRAEPVSILPSGQNAAEHKEAEKSAPKEEFVLTVEDLSSVSLVPTRPKNLAPSRAGFKPALMEPDPQLEPEPVAKALRNEPPELPPVSLANTSSLGYRFGKSAEISTDSRKPSQQPGIRQRPEVSSDKPVSTLFLPTMRYSDTVEPLTFSDDDRSSESSDHMHRPSNTLLLGSGAADDVSDTSSEKTAGQDSRRMSGSSASSQTLPSPADKDADMAREELQQQFSSLQDQFVLWQQQLQQNQALLASHGGGSADTNDDTLKTLQAQVQMQQQMMTQLQMSMQALALQQQADLPAPPVDILAPAVPAEESLFKSSLSPPSYPPPPPPSESLELPPPPPSEPPELPPPPPPPEASTPKVVKAATRPKASATSRFEPQLDPREELMIAIRSFGGRANLSAVSAKATKWSHSGK